MKHSLKKMMALTLLASGALASTQALADNDNTQQGTFVKENNTVSGETHNLQLPVNVSAAGNYFTGSLNITVGPTLHDGSITNGASFLAYCIDPFQYSLSSPLSYALSPLSDLGVTQAADVAKLYSQSYASTIGNNANSAAFQLALWELGKDDGSLSSGAVHVTDSTTASVVTTASQMISQAKTGAMGSTQYALNLYINQSAQDFLVASPLAPVPEPETYAMLLTGLTLMGWVSRRRQMSV